MHNTHVGVKYNVADEDPLLAAMPARIRHYVLFEAPWNCSLKEVQEYLNLGVPESMVLRALRTAQRQEAAELYGWQHPQASRF
jgi:hypothetical protein